MRKRDGITGVILAVVCAGSIACGDFREQMTDMLQLSRDVQATYHRQVAINLMNGHYLNIGIPVEGADSGSTSERQQFAHEIAKFARVHFKHSATLTAISVSFSHRDDYGGVVHVTHGYGQFTWSVADLAAEDSIAADQVLQASVPLVPLRLTVGALRPAIDTMFAIVQHDGRTDTTGFAIQSLRARSWPTRHAGGVWEQVYDARLLHQGVDTLDFDQTTLMPIEERGNSPGRGVLRAEFDGRHVRTWITPIANGQTTIVDTTFAVAPFASAQNDAVLRALPLAPGYRATAAFYFPGKAGFRNVDMRVTGLDSSCAPHKVVSPCWKVSSKVDGMPPVRFWITQTHVLAGVQDTTPSGNVLYWVQ